MPLRHYHRKLDAGFVALPQMTGRRFGMPFILSPPTLTLRFRQNNGPTPSGDYQPSRSLSMAGSVRTKQWHPNALACVGDKLQDKLKQAVNPQIILGTIAPYFTHRYGFNSVCKVLPWCGDNPSSLIGLGLIEPGMTAISLGTSDTYFGLFKDLAGSRYFCESLFWASQPKQAAKT